MAHHEPVMVEEVVAHLRPAAGGLYVDCTVGAGGHAQALLEAGASSLLGLDRDPAALELAARRLAPWGDRVELVHADYRDVGAVLDARGIEAVDGALADLGVSSMQLEGEGRGFSFRRDEPLDMRMDRTQGPTAADLLRDVAESDLADVIFSLGQERHSRRIARSIVAARRLAPLTSTAQLASVVRRAIPRRGWSRIDPATRTFQALRIWVNRELEDVDKFLEDLLCRLRAGARLVVITFHSLEDRIVKHTLRGLVKAGEALRILTPRPLVPGDDEVARNPRARSAKLRAAERLA
jgi:16S rRNA (cytosine1402-N4)-methyltransferase